MQIVYSLEDIPKNTSPVVLTIGNYDGLHLGHQAVLAHLVQRAKQTKLRSVVLTFSNHPSTVLRPHHQTHLICSTEHKLKLFEKASIEMVVMLPFTKEFSEQSADQFLKKVSHALPFQTLILGSDAHIGKNREGDQSTVTALADLLGFTVEYFPDRLIQGQRISSNLIRERLHQGNLKQAETLLGRPYSIYSTVLKGDGKGATLGFPTANLYVGGLCLPPLGVYAVSLFEGTKEYPGVANLGVAPTVHEVREPILEVHLFDHSSDLYGKTVEVRFHDFIRAEMRFNDLEELKAQIAQDVLTARKLHQLRS